MKRFSKLIALVLALTLALTVFAACGPATYKVTFDANGQTDATGMPTAMEKVEEGAIITAPTAPTSATKNFDGWYKEAAGTTAWNFTTDKVTANTTLYAKWVEKEYAVTFSANGQADATGMPAEMKVKHDGTITKPTTDPTSATKEFEGWYKEAAGTTAWNFATDKVTADTTIYAKWTEKFVEVAGDVYKADSYSVIGGGPYEGVYVFEAVLTINDGKYVLLFDYSDGGQYEDFTIEGTVTAQGDNLKLDPKAKSDSAVDVIATKTGDGYTVNISNLYKSTLDEANGVPNAQVHSALANYDAAAMNAALVFYPSKFLATDDLRQAKIDEMFYIDQLVRSIEKSKFITDKRTFTGNYDEVMKEVTSIKLEVMAATTQAEITAATATLSADLVAANAK